MKPLFKRHFPNKVELIDTDNIVVSKHLLSFDFDKARHLFNTLERELGNGEVILIQRYKTIHLEVIDFVPAWFSYVRRSIERRQAKKIHKIYEINNNNHYLFKFRTSEQAIIAKLTILNNV